MMMDWNQYHKEVGARIGDLMKVSPDTVMRDWRLAKAWLQREMTRGKTERAKNSEVNEHGGEPQ